MSKGKGILFVISGPSGVGKGTVLSEICRTVEDISLSVSVTTRKPRLGEKNGVNYYFISDEQFDKMVIENGLYEYVRALNRAYGTPKQAVIDKLSKGEDVILEIETYGAADIRRNAECVSIFIAPPSLAELKRRLIERGTETPGQIETRMKKCAEELPCAYDYDYIVINRNVGECVKEVSAIIEAERHKVGKNRNLISKIINS